MNPYPNQRQTSWDPELDQVKWHGSSNPDKVQIRQPRRKRKVINTIIPSQQAFCYLGNIKPFVLLSCVRRVKTKRHVRRAAEPAWQTREAASATGSAGPLPAAGQERWDQGSRRPARLVVAGTDWDPGRTAADQNRNDSAARPPLFCPPGRNCPPLSRHRRRSNGYLRHRCHLCHWHGSRTSGGWGLPCCCTWSSPTGWDWCRWWSAFWRGCARAWSSRSVPTWSKWSRRICYAGRESSDSLDSRQNNRSGELRHRESSVQNFPTVGTQVIMHVQTDCLYGDCKTKD